MQLNRDLGRLFTKHLKTLFDIITSNFVEEERMCFKKKRLLSNFGKYYWAPK